MNVNLSTKLLVFLLNFQLLSFPLSAQEGALDPDFGEGGIVKSYFYGGGGRAQTTLIQPDGKMLIAGYFANDIDGETSSDFFVIRLNGNGGLDYSFGTEGKVRTDFSLETPGVMNDYAQKMVLQPDGKIIVAGFTYLNGYAIMARYNPDGTLDTSFGTGGKVRTAARDLDNIYSLGITSLALQSDGKIVLGGSVYYTDVPVQPVNYNRFALFRYHTDGTLDTGFGSNGVSTLQLEYYNEATDSYIKWNSGITSIAIQTDDKIVAVGNSGGSASHEKNIAIARFHPNGNPDFSFAGDGKRFLRSSEDYKDSASDIVILPNGDIVLVGDAIRMDVEAEPGNEKYPILLAQLTNTGNLNINFGPNGIVMDDLRGMGAVNSANAISVQPDGKIVIAGSSEDRNSFSNSDFALARYNSNGTRDVSFGDKGKTFLSFAGKYPPSAGIIARDAAYALAIQTNGNIVAVGLGSVGNEKNIAVARYYADGILDNGFSADGKLDMSINKVIAYPKTLAMQQDDKIVAAGYVPNYGYAFTRYLNDGKIDSTFSSDGQAYIYMGGKYGVEKTLVQSDGKIVSVGSGKEWNAPSNTFVLVRLNEDGSRDEDFGDGGIVFSDFTGSNSIARTGLLQNDGKIVIGGRTNLQTTGRHFLLQRYHTDGSPDMSFGVDGSVTTKFTDDTYAEIYAMALQADGKIIAAGKANNQFTLVRYNTDGSLDTSFGSNGITQTAFNGNSEISDIVFQADGRITAGGYELETSPIANYNFALARYNSNGTLDASFGTNGKVTTDFGFDSDQRRFNRDEVRSIVYQDDGRLIAFGRSGSQDRLATFVLVRYNVDGSIDTGFGDNGVVSTASSDNRWEARVAILQSDNKLLALGNFTDDYNTGFALARYYLDETPVGIEDVFKPSSPIQVYPNPSSGIFSVRSPQHAISKVTVLNVHGQTVQSQAVSLAIGQTATVNLSKESKGIYFLHLKTEAGLFTQKIIVQ